MASRDNEEIFDVPSAEVPARTEQSESRPQRSASRMVNLAVMVLLFVGCCLLLLAAGCMLAAGACCWAGRFVERSKRYYGASHIMRKILKR